MKLVLCTIVTPDYIDRALALFLSAQRAGTAAKFVVLTTSDIDEVLPGVEKVSIADVCSSFPIAREICAKYADDKDRLRWSLKSALMVHLLGAYPDSVITYADSDISFFESPETLARMLGTGNILLTPHWRPLDPEGSSRNFRLNYMDGLFNAGCVTATAGGMDALKWWARACLAACEQNRAEGLWDDQRYLDLIPIYFDKAIICKHRGFNLADWNLHLRETDTNGTRDVPDRWPVSMIHFTHNTIRRIRAGEDPVLSPYYDIYLSLLAEAVDLLDRQSQTTCMQ
jgi:hypothetical protein